MYRSYRESDRRAAAARNRRRRRTNRYGRRIRTRPYNRDLPFWERLYPYRSGGAGDSSTEDDTTRIVPAESTTTRSERTENTTTRTDRTGNTTDRTERAGNTTDRTERAGNTTGRTERAGNTTGRTERAGNTRDTRSNNNTRPVEEKRATKELPVDDDEGRISESEVIAKKVLTIKKVDLHVKENAQKHRTDDYECTEQETDPQLVVRRGQEFMVTLTFDREWDSQKDDIFLDFLVGDEEADHTLAHFQLTEDDNTGYMKKQEWGARIVKKSGNSITIAIFPPAKCIVGEWEYEIITKLTQSKEEFTYEGENDICILFNPWCKDDLVYFPEEKELDEYIMNEYGAVFMGNEDAIHSKSWFYGQFRLNILDTCLTILRLAFDTDITEDMGDPVIVARKLSRMMNHNWLDPGLITGNWSGNYSGGTSPTEWRGSVSILEKYRKAMKTVKYGQCWVFSHVLTTVCRALGLPCRSVTNFESAHDTDKSATIDTFITSEGERVEGGDSVWNFHVWNECWIKRPDLPIMFSGWHAFDGTPQERSEKRFQCGPTPLPAIKEGELDIGYDTIFIFGEVNGEMCTWLSDNKMKTKLIGSDFSRVGKKMSTKIPDGLPVKKHLGLGFRDPEGIVRMDVTHLYKYPDGSQEERAVVEKALGDSHVGKLLFKPKTVELRLTYDNEVLVGKNLFFHADVINMSDSAMFLMKMAMVVLPVDNRGERLGWNRIAYERFDGATIPANSSSRFEVEVKEAAYLAECDKNISMELRAYAEISGEEKPVTNFIKMTLSQPDLAVRAVGASTVRDSQPFTVQIDILNPISKPLTNCRLKLSGSIVPLPEEGYVEIDTEYEKKIKDVFPNETRTVELKVKASTHPRRNRTRELSVDFACDQLPDFDGNYTVTIQ